MVIQLNAATNVIIPDFLLYPIIAGIAVALVAGPLGSFVVWRRMSYFGDTLAHSGLLGVSLGLLLNINPTLTIALTCTGIAVVLVFLQKKAVLSTDTLLGILSHSTLAIGLICISLFPGQMLNLNAYLMGDFLTIDVRDASLMVGLAFFILVIISRFWRKFLAVIVDEEIAKMEGIAVGYYKLLITILTALVIAFAMKIIGILMITALLIIPAATSRRLSGSPEAMAAVASMIAILAVLLGTMLSYFFDTPAGPSIILSCTVFYALVQFKRSKT